MTKNLIIIGIFVFLFVGCASSSPDIEKLEKNDTYIPWWGNK